MAGSTIRFRTCFGMTILMLMVPLYLVPLSSIVTINRFVQQPTDDGVNTSAHLRYDAIEITSMINTIKTQNISDTTKLNNNQPTIADYKKIIENLKTANARLRTLNNKSAKAIIHLHTLLEEKEEQLASHKSFQELRKAVDLKNEKFNSHVKEENTFLKQINDERKEELEQFQKGIQEQNELIKLLRKENKVKFTSLENTFNTKGIDTKGTSVSSEILCKKRIEELEYSNTMLINLTSVSVTKLQNDLKTWQTSSKQCQKTTTELKTIITATLSKKNVPLVVRKLLTHIENALNEKPVSEVAISPSRIRTLSMEVPEPFTNPKLVHLDLKGSPPRLDYLIWFIRFMKQYGANGFLVEYEDMFPWYGELEVIASPHAYTRQDIKAILKVAEEEGMMIIPLIQSFGHMQYVLKHKQFEDLRATSESSDSISALDPGSVPLVKSMIDQILELHPDVKWLHIGGDEVYNIARCKGCSGGLYTADRLYLTHMTPILKYIKSKNVKPIIWDDMLRGWTMRSLMELKGLVTPMIWQYDENLNSFGGYNGVMFKTYAKAFSKVWVASAFKGALAQDSNFVPIRKHLDNNLSWLQLVERLKSFKLDVVGIALTGWSRYWHDAKLCELLPAGIPSLTLCLATLKNGGYTDKIHRNISDQLGFNKKFYIGDSKYIDFVTYTPENATGYWGSDIYHLVGTVEKDIRAKQSSLSNAQNVISMSYSTKENARSIQSQLNTTLYSLANEVHMLKMGRENAVTILSKVYDSYVVDEWVKEKMDAGIEAVKDKMKSVLRRLDSIKKDLIKKKRKGKGYNVNENRRLYTKTKHSNKSKKYENLDDTQKTLKTKNRKKYSEEVRSNKDQYIDENVDDKDDNTDEGDSNEIDDSDDEHEVQTQDKLFDNIGETLEDSTPSEEMHDENESDLADTFDDTATTTENPWEILKRLRLTAERRKGISPKETINTDENDLVETYTPTNSVNTFEDLHKPHPRRKTPNPSDGIYNENINDLVDKFDRASNSDNSLEILNGLRTKKKKDNLLKKTYNINEDELANT